MKQGAKIVNIDDYRKQFCDTRTLGANLMGEQLAVHGTAFSGNAVAKRKPTITRWRNPYALIKLLRAQNWFAKREFLPRISVRLSAYTPCGKSAVKIKL